MLHRNRTWLLLLGLFLFAAGVWSSPAVMTPPAPPFPSQPTPKGTSEIPSTPAAHHLRAAYGKFPLQFEINGGQTAKQVRFLSRGSGYSLFLTPTTAVLSLRTQSTHPALSPQHPTPNAQHLSSHPSIRPAVLRLHILNSNPHPQINGADALPGKVNYFIGNDPKKWRTDIATYGKVRYQDVYPGIDQIYYGNQQQLEYDFLVAPGANPSTIRFNVQGAERISLNSRGELVMHTPSGDVIQHAPNIYQVVDGQRRNIAGGYILLTDSHTHTLTHSHTISFHVGPYNHRLPLTIDPVLVYSTYLGGSGGDSGNAIAVDSAGNAYVLGITDSADFPTKNAFRPTDPGGSGLLLDLFVAKLNASGTALVYSTYLGGSMATQAGFSPMAPNVGYQESKGIAVDAAGSAYISGSTNATDFPTTPGALQPAIGNGNLSAFVTKLSADGSSLVYSTYLSGAGAIGASRSGGIAVDAAGSAYVFGSAPSDFPVTPGAFQTTDRHISAFRSGNAGALWTPAGAGLPNDTILSLVVDPTNPNIVYAGTYNNNVYKTSDGGMNWHASSSGLPTKIYDPNSYLIVSAIYALVIDPVTPSTLYATTRNGPYKSLDGGATWNPSNTGLKLPLQTLVIDPKTPTTLYAAPESNLFKDIPGTANGGTPLYKSVDGGATWNPSSAGLPIYVQVLAVDPTNPSILYAANGENVLLSAPAIVSQPIVSQFVGVAKSTDGGAHWSRINQVGDGSLFTGLAVDPNNPSTLYLTGSNSGFFKSTDSGVTFAALNNGLPVSGVGRLPSLEGLAVAPTNPVTLYVSDGGIIYKSADGGATWQISDTGVTNRAARDLAVSPSQPATVYTGTFGANTTFVAKLNPAGSGLAYATFLGGSGGSGIFNGFFTNEIAVDAAGNAYVTGNTQSSDFPTTPGAAQKTFAGGLASSSSLDSGNIFLGTPSDDAFVSKISPDGSALVYSTYLGGSGNESGSAIAVDGAGNAYVTGSTNSLDFPTQKAVQPTFGGGAVEGTEQGDAFVTELNPTGTAFIYSTYLGGSGTDTSFAIAVDSVGNAFVIGQSDAGFPPNNPLSQTGAITVAFVAKISSGGAALSFPTVLPIYPGWGGIALDAADDIFLTGGASNSFPTTPGAFQTKLGGRSDAFIVKISPDLTTTTLTAAPNPALPGQTITLTATVAPVAPATGIPAGAVRFLEGANLLGTGTLNATGMTTFSTAALTAGTHLITATYTGTDVFAASSLTTPLSVTVTAPAAAGTTTTLTSSANPSVSGQSVTFTASVAHGTGSTGTPTGTITFNDGTTAIGMSALTNGTAAITVSTLSVGSHSITAIYSGNTGFTGSTSSAVTQVVNKAATTTTITPPGVAFASGAPVNVTATVSPVAPGTGSPTGTITFLLGTMTVGTGTIANGKVSAALTGLATGSNSITASYGGDTNFNSSATPAVTVTVSPGTPTQSTTTITLTSSANPSTVGQSVTFTATVTAVGGGVPTGTVNFNDGPSALGTGTLTNGIATFSTSMLVVGSHSITAVYSGSSSFTGSTSNTLSQVVNAVVTGPLFTFPAGLSLVSLPFNYTGTAADAQLLFGVASLSGGVVPIATANPATATYLYYPNLPDGNGKQPQPGRGYWILETTPHNFLPTDAGATVSSPFTTTLQGGWNQIGDPFNTAIDVTTLQFSVNATVGSNGPNTFLPLPQAQAANLVRSSLYSYNQTANRYDAATSLQPFLGYWIYIDPKVSGGLPVTVRFVNAGAVNRRMR